MSHLIRLHEVTKKFGTLKAVSNINLTVGSGNIALITGENGAGKSTLLKLMAGLISIDKGKIERFSSKIHYIGTSCGLYGPLTCKENIQFFLSSKNISSTLESNLDMWGVLKFINNPVKSLSKGQQMRIALAIMFNSNADLYLLDEPTAYLDDTATNLFCNSILESNKTYVIATHDMTRLSILSSIPIKMSAGAIL